MSACCRNHGAGHGGKISANVNFTRYSRTFAPSPVTTPSKCGTNSWSVSHVPAGNIPLHPHYPWQPCAGPARIPHRAASHSAFRTPHSKSSCNSRKGLRSLRWLLLNVRCSKICVHLCSSVVKKVSFGFRISVFGFDRAYRCLVPIIGSAVKKLVIIRAIRVKVFVLFVAFCSKNFVPWSVVP